MNTPNKLTLIRVIIVPAFVVFLLYDTLPYNYLIALLLFVAASITDFADGYLARRNGQITTFGKFLDPLADKILVISALVCFACLGLAHPIAVIVIIAREFMVTSIRLVAADSGTVIAAAWIGKVKTVIQMIAIIAPLTFAVFSPILFKGSVPLNEGVLLASNILCWISAAFTVYSGIQYLIENKSIINTTR